MPLPRPASPRVLWTDLRSFWQERPRHQWVAAVLALIVPVGILVGFYFDSRTNILPGERVMFVDSWPADRSDAEIKAKQEADLELRRAREEERQRQFQRLDERLKRVGI